MTEQERTNLMELVQGLENDLEALNAAIHCTTECLMEGNTPPLGNDLWRLFTLVQQQLNSHLTGLQQQVFKPAV